jgi:two-component system response regulator RegX3
VARVHAERGSSRRSTSVLVFNHDTTSALALTSTLERHGFSVRSPGSGVDQVKTFAALAPDVVLIDLDGVAASGLELCRRIRAVSDVPIVLTSSADVEIDVIVGLELGADRHVHMPANPVALAARIEALVRRCSQPSVGRYAAVVRVGDVTLDRARHRVTVRGESGATRALEAHIKRLRAVIELDPSCPQRIVTVRGVGYKYLDPRGPQGSAG